MNFMKQYAILIAGSLSLVLAMPAMACSSLKPFPTEDQLFASSSAVFLAHLQRVEEVGSVTPNTEHGAGNGDKIVEGTFRLLETIKGQPPADNKIKSLAYGTGNCSLPLLAGNDYLFFLESDNFVLLWHGGAEALINIESAPTREMLDKLRNLARQRP
jgi:hypothetical protein